jgi:hypothetical protein
MPSFGQTWVLASIGGVVEMGILSTLRRLLMESTDTPSISTQKWNKCMVVYFELGM